MGRKRKNEPWYFKYLRREINRIWGWDPERKKARNRALISKNPELFHCEDCNKQPLQRNEVEINHIYARESVEGWAAGNGWAGYIDRTFAPYYLLEVLCKACHRQKTNEQNATRREANGKRKGSRKG